MKISSEHKIDKISRKPKKNCSGWKRTTPKKIRHNNTQQTKDEKSILMVAAPGWASPLDPRQCALCRRRCAVSTTLTPRRLSSKRIDTKILSETLFGMLKSKVSDRQRFYGMPKDVSEIETYLKTAFLRDSSKTSRVNHPLGPLLTAWYNEEYADEEKITMF